MRSGEVILDVGCGDGWMSNLVKGSDALYIGLDIIFRIKNHKMFNENFIKASAEHIPIHSSCVSLIICNHVLEHIQDDHLVLDEIARVLKVRGKLFLSAPNVYSRMLPIFWAWYKYVDVKVKHFRHYKAEKLIEEVRKRNIVCKHVGYITNIFRAIAQFLLLFTKKMRYTHFLWWKLEKLDKKLKKCPSGAHLYLVAEKL